MLACAQQDQPPPLATPAANNVAETSDAASLPDLKPDANGSLSQEQMQHLFRVVADKDIENDKRLRDYTYIERDEEHKLDGKGRLKSTEGKTYEVMELYSEQVQRLTEKDDKPLDSKGAAKEEEKIQKILDKRKNESEDARKKREAKRRKRARGRPPVRARGGRCLQFSPNRYGILGRARCLGHRCGPSSGI